MAQKSIVGGGSNTTTWTPDGKYLIYSKLSEGAHHDAAYQPELGNHMENVFSPESAKEDVRSISLILSLARRFRLQGLRKGKWDFRGAVSPDGKTLAYTSAKVGGRGEVFILPAGWQWQQISHRWQRWSWRRFSPLAGYYGDEDSQLSKNK